MPKSTALNEHRYLQLADSIEGHIEKNLLKVGDKLPSVRLFSEEHGVSMGTSLQAYYHLEAKGLIESRPKSGYYVRYSSHKYPEVPRMSDPETKESPEDVGAIVSSVFNHLNDSDFIRFSLGVPAPELLPQAKLNKAMVQAMRDLPASGTSYDPIQGNESLRRQIAKNALSWQGNLHADDIITTAGCINALAYCLMALTEKGDTIIVESPVYFGILQLAHSLGLQVLELPTHPVTGIALDALRNHLQKGGIKLVLLVSNFSNPLGSCMPEENKKEVVRLIEQYNIPLVEDDLYGDLYFGKSRPKPCKAFDQSGLVLWCSSVSKTLVPGYRVGWVAPGRFKEQILRLKMNQSISTNALSQQAVANFLANGRYENHLWKLRQALQANSLQFIRSVSEYFPEGTRVSRPQGGFMLWVELDPGMDTYELYKQALKQQISIAPGRMFTLRAQYQHCMRLSYGLLWTDRVEGALKTLGTLAKK
ncbi:MAG: PLP-dependent aminotransferase family protein [Bacteroidota bacterium]